MGKILPWLIGGGLLYMVFGGKSASAATSAPSAPLSGAGTAYYNKITGYQLAFNNGQMSSDQMSAGIQGVMASANADPAVTSSDLATLRSISGV